MAAEYQLSCRGRSRRGWKAGDVVEINGAEGVGIGDKVIVKMRHGAYSDEAVVTPSQLTTLPSTFDYAEGATFLAGHGTAYHALIDRGQVKPGEVLLVHLCRRRRGPRRGRDGQDAGLNRDRGGFSEEKLAIAKARWR